VDRSAIGCCATNHEIRLQVPLELKNLSEYCKKQEVPVRTLQGLIIQHGTLTLLM